ncbi:MAG TPA: hypothetical protein DCL44_06300 [Elusimicrobia bacterium]|nr:hypothetical protein [Elusimicrobiota bacterium]
MFLTIPAWSAENKPAGEGIAESLKTELTQEKEARKQAMENYWDSQPKAGAVMPNRLFLKLKKIPWPDTRPVPKDKYFERPEVKARELKTEGGNPPLASPAKKEKELKNDLETARKESDETRFNLWAQNTGFYRQAIADSETGRITGSERVKALESALVFIKEGEPRFYLRDIADKCLNKLEEMGTDIKALIAKLEQTGQYIPDYQALEWAEKIGGRLSAGEFAIGEPVVETEKQRYYKITDRVVRFDPRVSAAKAQGEEVVYVPGPGNDPKWEKFISGLIERNNKMLSRFNLSATAENREKICGDIESSMRKMLAEFPAGWEKYPRAKWAHDWFTRALEKSRQSFGISAKGTVLYQALNTFDSGLN